MFRAIILFTAVLYCQAQSPGINFVCQVANKQDCSLATQIPVCATNGVLYPSECEFIKAQCKDINIDVSNNSGRCSQPQATTQPPTTATASTSDMMNGTTDSTSDMMNGTTDSTSDMMNGTTDSTSDMMNGTTDSTSDMMNGTTDSTSDMVNGTTTSSYVVMTTDMAGNDTNATSSVDVSMSSTSAATPMATTTTTTTMVTTTPVLSPLCKVLVSTVCPVDNSPVCGSNYVEYTSICQFTKAQCYDPSLQILGAGACPAVTTVGPSSAYDIICNFLSGVDCTDDDDVIICASNGNVYSSCTYEKAKCANETLTIQSMGPCDQ